MKYKFLRRGNGENKVMGSCKEESRDGQAEMVKKMGERWTCRPNN